MSAGERITEWVGNHPKASLALFATGILSTYYPISLATGEATDALYGAGAARELVRDHGYTHVRLLQVDHVFAGFKDCHGPGIDSKDVEYEFDATDADGASSEVDVCKGLFSEAELVIPTRP